MNHPDLTGYIFRHNGKYWKITGPARHALGSESYPVILCSMTGLEYKQKNGFLARKVLELHRQGLVYKATANGRADIEQGNAEGARKRRIAFLKDRIAEDTAELNKLLGQADES